MAKPFSIQSPEDIAKQYAGNKQKIGEAMQMGIIDPTAGVLAGMFIDRMRGAQAQESANPPTVAQQVMGGLPPAPSAPPLAAGGMGAPPMAPAMQAPAPEMSQAPMGMADGGLASLPVPDAMFDEPTNGGFNDGYAGGGIVAFGPGGSTGGMSDLYDSVEYWESGGDQSAVSPAGARGVMQLMPGTMKDPGFGVPSLAELMKQGMSEEEANRTAGRKYLDAMYRRYGDQATALAAYNWGPGNVDKWLKSGADPKKLPAETRKYVKNVMGGDEPPVRERDTATAAGRLGSLEDIIGAVQGINRKSDEEVAAEKRVKARLEEKASDEGYEKQRKADMWQTLAEIGFNMASSKSPYVLQAIGEAAAASMPGARADKKDRKEAKDRALEGLMELGARSRTEAMEALKVAIPVWQSGMEAEQFERGIEQKEKDRQFESEMLDRKIGAELAAAGIAATAKDRDIYTRAAEARYQELKRINDGLPANQRKADSTLMDMALTGIIGMRSSQSSTGASLEDLLKGQGGGSGSGTGGFTVTRE